MRHTTLLSRSAAMVLFATASIGFHASPAQAQTTQGFVQFESTIDPVQGIAEDAFAGGDLWQVSQASKKSPALAFLLSFLIPGAGQGYNGQWGKGAGLFIGELVSLGVTAAGAGDCVNGRDCGVAIAGFVGMVGFWWASWIDAPISASAINRRIDAGGMALEIGPRLYLDRNGRAVSDNLVVGQRMLRPIPHVSLSLIKVGF